MTGAIHQRQREAETLAGLIREKKQHTVTRKHHAVQRMLKPLAVVNPYAEYLSYPSHSLRARRGPQEIPRPHPGGGLPAPVSAGDTDRGGGRHAG
ncbi:MAG: hypothetical protein JKP90_06655 [Desulfofustis sp. PB-SRB1]|nr:hypothetical protein [Desulfofustis sp. PB-SRB1]